MASGGMGMAPASKVGAGGTVWWCFIPQATADGASGAKILHVGALKEQGGRGGGCLPSCVPQQAAGLGDWGGRD